MYYIFVNLYFAIFARDAASSGHFSKKASCSLTLILQTITLSSFKLCHLTLSLSRIGIQVFKGQVNITKPETGRALNK